MPIPTIIHQTWKTKQVPADYHPMRESVLELHRGWDIRLYDDHDCRSIIAERLPELLGAYDGYPNQIQRTDFFRVVAVFLWGGFYVDLDVTCHRNLQSLDRHGCIFPEEITLSEEEKGTYNGGLNNRDAVRVGNYMFGSQPGHPFLWDILQEMTVRGSRPIHVENDILETTGPGLITAMFHYLKHQYDDLFLLQNEGTICEECQRLSCQFGTYATHHHLGSWRWHPPEAGAWVPAGPEGTMKTRSSLCLVMIVKDESAIIQRALASVRSHIDYWVICDTGSTDNTKALVDEALRGIPGELHEREWRGFGHNRSEAMKLARDKADYSLIMDADMVLNVFDDAFRSRLSEDSYLLRYEGGIQYYQVMLVSNKHDWSFIGATHEYIHSDTATSQTKVTDISLTHLLDGQSRDVKYSRDIALLLDEHEREPDNSRTMFYLAQTYRENGQLDEALHWYRKRVEAGGWQEEVWYSMYQIGLVLAAKGAAWESVLNALLEAYEYRPSRMEPIYVIARHYRIEGQYALGYLFSKVVKNTLKPDDLLFLDAGVYEYQLPTEYAVCCYWQGHHEEAIRTYNDILSKRTPSEYVELAVRNRTFSTQRARLAASDREQGIQNRIKVVTTAYNPGLFLDNCVASLRAQSYLSFEVIIIDDASDDESYRSVPLDDPRFKLIRNDERVGGACNLHRVFAEYCQPDDIVVVVDGDDWLACDDALEHINRTYNERACWAMYGQFRFVDGSYGFSKPFPGVRAFEQTLRDVWFTSHVKTFRAGLYHAIASQDPTYSCMKDNNGAWYKEAMDMAFYYPVLELAGFERVHFNERVLYVYNNENPLNVHKKRRELEIKRNIEIVHKKRFQRISEGEMLALGNVEHVP